MNVKRTKPVKLEKTFLFAIKSLMMICLFITFFGFFMIQIPQLKTLNRTSIVSFGIFFISVFSFIRIYGGFPVGKKHTSDIRNYAILGTLVGDIITFITMYVMGISATQYYEFSDEFVGPVDPLLNNQPSFSTFLGHYLHDKVLPGLAILLIVIILQIIIIWIFARFSNTIYFKINMPKKAMIIYNYIEDLPILVSKIKKNPHRWKLTQLVKYDDKKILRKIRGNGAVFFFDVPREKRAPLLEFCYKHNKDIYISPDVSDIIVYSSSRLIVDDTTVLSTTNYGMSFEQLLLKRLGDIIFSSIFIVLTSPIMLFFATAIMIYDHGPVIYKQKRLTKDGKEFNLLKFRSMIVNAEKNTGAMIAKEDDDRITPIGKILRRFRIDELPQLFNIFKGDMSVVGPRPERMEIAEEYKKQLPEFQYRLKVKAGLTGLAQIMSKYNTTPKDKLTLDLAYIQQYSLWLDIKLIFQTLIVFLKSDSTEGSKDIDNDTIEFVKKQLKKTNKKQTDNYAKDQ